MTWSFLRRSAGGTVAHLEVATSRFAAPADTSASTRTAREAASSPDSCPSAAERLSRRMVSWGEPRDGLGDLQSRDTAAEQVIHGRVRREELLALLEPIVEQELEPHRRIPDQIHLGGCHSRGVGGGIGSERRCRRFGQRNLNGEPPDGRSSSQPSLGSLFPPFQPPHSSDFSLYQHGFESAHTSWFMTYSIA